MGAALRMDSKKNKLFPAVHLPLCGVSVRALVRGVARRAHRHTVYCVLPVTPEDVDQAIEAVEPASAKKGNWRQGRV